jgi:hypothetical protein
MPRAEPGAARGRVRGSATIAADAKSAAQLPGRGDAAAARAHTGEALATLVAIMTNGDAPATARVSAANAVLDRAWGKPRQDFELSSAGDAVAAIQRARQRVHRQRQAKDAEHGTDDDAHTTKAGARDA